MVFIIVAVDARSAAGHHQTCLVNSPLGAHHIPDRSTQSKAPAAHRDLVVFLASSGPYEWPSRPYYAAWSQVDIARKIGLRT